MSYDTYNIDKYVYKKHIRVHEGIQDLLFIS